MPIRSFKLLNSIGLPAIALVIGCDARAQTASKIETPTVAEAEAQREDLDVFERDFFKADRSYSVDARAEAAKRIDELRAKAGTISATLFALRLSQIAALADNGHTGVLDPGRLADSGYVGIRLEPFGQDFVVVASDDAHRELLGGRLVAIDETPVARLHDATRTLNGGTELRRDGMATRSLESPSHLYALGIAKAPTQATFRFELRSGSVKDALLTVTWRGLRGPESQLGPRSADDGMTSLLAGSEMPWALRDPGVLFRTQDQPALDAAVIQLRANTDAGTSIATFLKGAEVERRKNGRKNVILDMRMNGGGDLQRTQTWMTELPSRLPADGRIVVLTSRWTFSAAISSIGYLKQAGGARVMIVGEPVGDRLRFWAEGRPIFLPNSGAMVLMATQRHDYLTGCKGFDDCHEYVVTHPIAVASLDPDVLAPWTLDAYAAGRDPAMEAAARLLTKSR